MKPERAEEVARLFDAALECEPAKRAAFLAEACAGDDLLRVEIESLLEHAEPTASFMQDSAVGMIVQEIAEDSASSQAQKITHNPIEDDITNKPRKRPPWWMYAIGAAFFICATVRYYAFIIAPENAGIIVQNIADENGLAIGAVVQSVVPGSAAARAGLRPGDIIPSASSDGFIPSEPRLAPLYWETGRTYRIEIQRKEEIRTIALTLKRNPLSSWWTGPMRANLVLAMISLLYLILAATVGFKRPDNNAARWGALWLANLTITAIYAIYTPVGWCSTLMSFPRLIGWLAMFVLYSTGFNQWIGITFLAVFPRRLFHWRWIWVLIWLPALVVIPVTLVVYPNPMHTFSRWWPDWYDGLWRLFVIAATAALPLVAILNYWRLRNPAERRRLRIVLAGLTISAIVAISFLARLILLPWEPVRRAVAGTPAAVWFVFACLYAAFPISMAYAILRHRLFDIRVMIRLAVKYAAARGALISLVPIISAVFAGDLLLHGNQPLMQILRERGWIYVLLAIGGFYLHIQRRAWLDALDRRFFREHYNAQAVLRSVVDEVRAARDFQKVAPYVITQIQTALHPEFAALMLRRPGDDRYSSLTAPDKSLPAVPVHSKLMALVRVVGKPVEVPPSQTGWPWNQLPEQEIEYLRKSRIEWLFPIRLDEDRTEALLVLGPKRSEEPYAREDQELLQALTGNLALLLEEAPTAPTREGFEECPECGACYDSGSGRCAKEGARLTPATFPRLLDQRYRLEQRLGGGGMGTVYKAFDTELERLVAIKMMRPDLTASADAAARFKREAKAAASFSHPNVVTVYDFGAEGNRRAYLVMELLHGSTLRQELKCCGRLPSLRVSGILGGVCTAVDAAHQKKLLHRDLKPENIFLLSSRGIEIAKILDFGVAKSIALPTAIETADQTDAGMLVGTLMYMSPEQLRGGKAAESWDLWALAVVAYEMLAGNHPFAGSTTQEVRSSILARNLTPLRTYLPKAPPSWQHFFDKALADRVESRPNSALQLYAGFENCIRS